MHVDVEKLGRIPAGGGHRTLGTAGTRNKKKQVPIGYSPLHWVIDDHSRAVYSEILTNEKQETAAAFWVRANAFYTSQGITVLRVMTDIGSCYRSRCFNDALAEGTHKYTRPSLPRTNGKIECFHSTLAAGWAYARHDSSDQARAGPYQAWIHE